VPDAVPTVPTLEVTRQEELGLERSAALEADFVLSPYVWQAADTYEMLVRVVNRNDDPEKKVARIHRAMSADGLRFTMDDTPVVAPGPDERDDGGCEDPTVVLCDSGYDVYYSGYSRRSRASTLLLANGSALEALVKRGPVLPHDSAFANAKEASVVRCDDGYRLFFEYSRDEASRIGCATSESSHGPWRYVDCEIDPRPNSWDAWHLSPGPIIATATGTKLMFYNGATRDAHWRIGWVELDPQCRHVTARTGAPLVVPPPTDGDRTDIAFLASVVEVRDALWLYYAIGDRQLMRAQVSRQNV